MLLLLINRLIEERCLVASSKGRPAVNECHPERQSMKPAYRKEKDKDRIGNKEEGEEGGIETKK